MANKTIVVTGASSGFGRLTADALARAGHTVYASMRETTGRNASQVADVEKYAKDNGVDLRAIELDVSSEASRYNGSCNSGCCCFRLSRRVSFLRARDHGRADVQELHEVLRKDQVKRPVKGHAQFLFEPRELAQVNRSPEPPGDKP